MANRITEDYDSYDKAELQAEADARGLQITGTGSNGAVVKDDIVSALEDNDTAPDQPKPPLPPLVASPIPQITSAIPEIESGVDACEFPADSEFTDGLFVSKEDGEDYALCIHDPDGYGNTHSLKNSRHTWQGKEEQFNATFTRK